MFSLWIAGHIVVAQSTETTIDVDYPGGNIIVDHCQTNSSLYYTVSGDTIHIRPDLRDTKGDWFYWNFRVSGAANRTLVFQFPSRKVGSFGPAISRDGGKNWQWLYEKIYKGHDRFTYSFGPNEKEVMFSVCIPYLQADFERFISRYRNHKYVTIGTLTRSEKGRNVEKLLVQHPKNKPDYNVAITARHHANESMANYALEGFIGSLLNDDDPRIKWLRDHAGFFIVPFMDKDGVEDGDQGKNRMPRDHVLDYADKAMYNSTAALRKQMQDWGKGKSLVALDFHCPWLYGNWNEHIYFVGAKDQKIAQEQRIFVDAIANNQQGELLLDRDPSRSILDWGKEWNMWDDSGDQLGFTEWFATMEGVSLSVILEFPFASNNGQKITPENARKFGKDMAMALAVYLRK